MAGFCPNCGKALDDGTIFCGGCGTKQGEAESVQASTSAPLPPSDATQVAAPTPTPVTPAAPGAMSHALPATAQSSGSGCGRALLIVGVLVLLLAALGIGGFVYVAYKAKKKVDEIKQAYKTGNLDKMAGAIKGADSREIKDADPMPNYPEYMSGGVPSAAPEAAGGRPVASAAGGEVSLGRVVPMKKGLRITTAIQQSNGDYESIKAINSVNSEAVTMDYSADVPEAKIPFDNDSQKKQDPARIDHVRVTRKILRTDLQEAHEYAENFSPNGAQTIPNTTALGVSASVLNDLKTKGESPFSYAATGLKGALGNLLGGLGAMGGGRANLPGGQGAKEDKEAQDSMKDLQDMTKTNCLLKRRDNKTHAFPVLLNGVRTQVPAIRATCKSEEDEEADFYFLDDPQNPLSLTWKLGSGDRLQVIKLDYVADTAPTVASGASKELEQKLENKEKVQIYGIYFDFASAKIKPESKPTLDEIATVLKAHPDWKLRVDGHTDNVGTDPGNLELSKQRAGSVKSALANDYQIAAERLDTNGYGASSPVETNATMEGRARNRRVELSRE